MNYDTFLNRYAPLFENLLLFFNEDGFNAVDRHDADIAIRLDQLLYHYRKYHQEKYREMKQDSPAPQIDSSLIRRQVNDLNMFGSIQKENKEPTLNQTKLGDPLPVIKKQDDVDVPLYKGEPDK